jgi:hypothetical protein
MRLRLATYPNETPDQWLVKARDRSLTLPSQAAAVGADLKRWLPTTWPMDEVAAAKAIASSVRALDQGIVVMEAISGAATVDHAGNVVKRRSASGRS